MCRNPPPRRPAIDIQVVKPLNGNPATSPGRAPLALPGKVPEWGTGQVLGRKPPAKVGQTYKRLADIRKQDWPTRIGPQALSRVPEDRHARSPRSNASGDVYWCLASNTVLADASSPFCDTCRPQWDDLVERRRRWRNAPTRRVQIQRDDIEALHDRKDEFATSIARLFTAHTERDDLTAPTGEVLDAAAALLHLLDRIDDPRPVEQCDESRRIPRNP